MLVLRALQIALDHQCAVLLLSLGTFQLLLESKYLFLHLALLGFDTFHVAFDSLPAMNKNRCIISCQHRGRLAVFRPIRSRTSHVHFILDIFYTLGNIGFGLDQVLLDQCRSYELVHIGFVVQEFQFLACREDVRYRRTERDGTEQQAQSRQHSRSTSHRSSKCRFTHFQDHFRLVQLLRVLLSSFEAALRLCSPSSPPTVSAILTVLSTSVSSAATATTAFRPSSHLSAPLETR